MDKDLTKGKGMTVGETQNGILHSVFNLGEMPMALLDEAWHRYHPYTMTKNHRNRLSTIRKVANSDCAQQIREVKQAITSTYLIPKGHFAILEGERGLCAAILVAMTDDNAAIIEHEMEGQGFRIALPIDMICMDDSQQRRWMEMHFAPAAPDDVTFELKLRYSTVYCLVPSELEASVEKHGIPAPISIIRGDATMEEIQEFANHQPQHTHHHPNPTHRPHQNQIGASTIICVCNKSLVINAVKDYRRTLIITSLPVQVLRLIAFPADYRVISC